MLGKRLKELRTEKGITLKQLGKILNLGESTMSMYESEKRSPDYDTLLEIANFFSVSTDYLLGKTSFRKPMELFEHWSGHNNPYFEAPFDFGMLLKEERVEQDISIPEISQALNITISDVEDIEEGVLPLNYELAEKYAKFLGTSVKQIFIDHGMDASLNDVPLERRRYYQEQGMDEYEMSEAEEKFRKAEYQDAIVFEKSEAFGQDDIETIAAHKDGEEWTEEELKTIEEFKAFVKSQRKNKE